ncbi:MAG TPA: PH domain-containing protein [Patescibacteria group bacterium]|nr:PH domain-containing protein [Patescibacteria group bacterium]
MPDVFVNAPDTDPVVNPSSGETQKFNINPSNVEDLPNHTHNPLSAYCYFPHGVGFINKEPDEKIILLVRRHVITNLGWITLVIIMLVAPAILNYFPLLGFLPLKFQTLAVLFWYLLTLAIAIQGFLSWFFTVNIVTNLRVIDIDFDNLIYRKVTDAKLDHIEDATVKMGSVIRTLFDYGDVLIQTAAEVPEVEFWAVPHPDKIDKLLSDLRLESHP